MNKATRTRRGGFTLVELLIVIIIIAILAGMMMLTTGSATDRAEATKVINDLRAYKSAALMYYVDNNNTWPWAAGATAAANLEKSLSKYIDRSLDKRYSDGIWCRGVQGQNVVIGVRIADFSEGVKKKLADSARDAGLYMTPGNADNVQYFVHPGGNTQHIYMRLR